MLRWTARAATAPRAWRTAEQVVRFGPARREQLADAAELGIQLRPHVGVRIGLGARPRRPGGGDRRPARSPGLLETGGRRVQAADGRRPVAVLAPGQALRLRELAGEQVIEIGVAGGRAHALPGARSVRVAGPVQLAGLARSRRPGPRIAGRTRLE